jgi:hypothetical protein
VLWDVQEIREAFLRITPRGETGGCVA